MAPSDYTPQLVQLLLFPHDRCCPVCDQPLSLRAGHRPDQKYCCRACYLAAAHAPDATAHPHTLYRRRHAAGLTRTLTAHTVSIPFFLTWSEALAWLVGLIWSDGNLHRNTVSVVSKDHDLLATVAELVGLSSQVERKDGQVWRVRWTCRPVTERLRAIGLTPNKSFTITWPLLPREYGAAFVRGLLDGDGMVGLSQTRPGQQAPDLRVSWFTASVALRDALQGWLADQDISCRVTRSHTSVWNISVRQHASLKCLHALLYPSPDVPCLARKRAAFELWLASPRYYGGSLGRLVAQSPYQISCTVCGRVSAYRTTRAITKTCSPACLRAARERYGRENNPRRPPERAPDLPALVQRRSSSLPVTRPRPAGVLRGESHGGAKLSNAAVIEIRALADVGYPDHEIAAAFGITIQNVRLIRMRKSWRHI